MKVIKWFYAYEPNESYKLSYSLIGSLLLLIIIIINFIIES